MDVYLLLIIFCLIPIFLVINKMSDVKILNLISVTDWQCIVTSLVKFVTRGGDNNKWK